MAMSESPCAQGAADAAEGFVVLCLCADWCGTCREYRPAFDALAEQFPGVGFGWLDIEDHADLMGDLDIENFPTLLIVRRNLVLFFGTMLPHIGHLRRTIETFLEQGLDESRQYVGSNAERRAWQADDDLRRLAGQWPAALAG